MRALTILAFLLSPFAHAADFSGNWVGKGSWIDGSADDAVQTLNTLHIEQTTDRWRFKECWSFSVEPGAPQNRCIESELTVEGEDLYSAGKKVGDIFPDRILIYQGNHQVGEQIYLEMGVRGSLRYRYSYINADGASERRDAHLALIPRR